MQEIIPNLKQSREDNDNVIGFPDLFKGSAANDSVIRPIEMQKVEEGQTFGGSTNSSVASAVGDLTEASELSMEELEKQTGILENIDENTSKAIATATSAGGQTPPPTSEEEIRKKLDETKPLDEEQGKKIIGKLAEIEKNSKKTTSLLALAGAFAGSQTDLLTEAVQNMWNDLSTTQKVMAGIGATLSIVATALGIKAGASAATSLLTGGKDKKPDGKDKKPDGKDKKPDGKDKKPDGKPKTTAADLDKKPDGKPKAKTSKVVQQGVKNVGKFAGKQLGKVAAIAASGPAAPIVAGVMAAATVYELGTMALEKAGLGEEVEAFETGVTNFFGFDTDEQELEADAAKVALNTKKMNDLVQKIDMADITDEEKERQKAELQKALDNSGDVDWFGDAEARRADNTFAKYEKKYGAVDLEAPSTPLPQSAMAIEAETVTAKEAEVAAMVPQVNVPPQMPPQVNVPQQPTPNISVSAVLPRTNMPSELSSHGIQARIPKLITA